MKRIKTHIAVLMMAAVAASGCSLIKKGTPKTPVLGERVAVLTSENDVEVDPATAALPMALPAGGQRRLGAIGRQPVEDEGHVALGNSLARRSAFRSPGSSMTARLGGRR